MLMSSPLDRADRSRGYASDQGPRRNVRVHESARSDNSPVTDRHSLEDQGAGADPHMVTDSHRLDVRPVQDMEVAVHDRYIPRDRASRANRYLARAADLDPLVEIGSGSDRDSRVRKHDEECDIAKQRDVTAKHHSTGSGEPRKPVGEHVSKRDIGTGSEPEREKNAPHPLRTTSASLRAERRTEPGQHSLNRVHRPDSRGAAAARTLSSWSQLRQKGFTAAAGTVER